MKIISLIKNGRRIDIPLDQLNKGGAGSGKPSGYGGGPKVKEKPALATPAKRKLSSAEAFPLYVRMKDGVWGKNIQAKALNGKVGMAEGIAKAYRERAGKMKEGEEYKGKTREQYLATAKKLQDSALESASKRDSLLGRYAHKLFKQDYSEEELIAMIESGEFDDVIRQELESDIGEKLDVEIA